MIKRSASSLFQSLLPPSSFRLLQRNHSTFRAASSLPEISEPFSHRAKHEDDDDDEYPPPMDWDTLGFAFNPAEFMYTMSCSKDDESFKPGKLSKYGQIQLSPCAAVLNYGQGLIEGTKAYRREDGGIFVFRPDESATRMRIGAERMCMRAPSLHQFVDAVKQTALANKRWIPPAGKGSLYIRPILIGSGAVLGLAPSPEYTFMIYASPVGNYFKGAKALSLYVEHEFHRATRGGAGGVKCITNYAPVLKSLSSARGQGFSDVLYLDAVNQKYIEEVSTSNIFLVKGNVISTPTPSGTILEGITRKSIMEVALDLGYKVEERLIAIDELSDADEVFCTGTAAGVAPVGSITFMGNRIEYNTSKEMVSERLQSRLEGIQKGTIEDKKGWAVEID